MSGVLVQIRDVDRDVRDRLKARAAAAGMSLNSYLKDVLAADAALPSRAQVVERLRARGDLIEQSDTASTLVDDLERLREERARHLMALSSGAQGEAADEQDGG